MRRLAWLLPMLFIAMVACSKSSNSTAASSAPETSSAASAAPAVSTSCASLSHISPLTDKGVQTASGSTVNLEADNDNGQFYFDPSCVKSSGGTLSVTIKNTGSVEHNFTVKSLNIDKDIEKGESVTVSVKLPTSGVLMFYCEYHHASGMQGAFIVG